MKKILVLLLLTGMGYTANAQFTAKQKAATVDSVCAVLNRLYVFPKVAKQMETYIRERLARKAYDTITDGGRFAEVITADLYSIGNDKHINMSYSAEVLPAQNDNPMQLSPEEEKGYALWLKSENYGITKLEVLPGNIGYIDFKWFCGPEYGGETHAAAMNYVAHTDALIIDLRNSQGAMSTEVIPFICSYFFERSTHLNDLYWRRGDSTVQTWTTTMVPGKKYLDKPIYILTSGKTFSGAEEFAYDLKNLKRATIIGETTGGGANGGGSVRVDDHFSLFVPMGRAINPITKTNWEGVGVSPDTAVKSNRALHKAQMIALQQLIATSTDSGWKQRLQELYNQVQSNTPNYKQVTFTLKGFETAKAVSVAGSFNNWSPRSDQMQRKGDSWVVNAEAEPGRHLYKFVVDGRWLLDPANPVTAKENNYDNSVIVVE